MHSRWHHVRTYLRKLVFKVFWSCTVHASLGTHFTVLRPLFSPYFISLPFVARFGKHFLRFHLPSSIQFPLPVTHHTSVSRDNAWSLYCKLWMAVQRRANLWELEFLPWCGGSGKVSIVEKQSRHDHVSTNTVRVIRHCRVIHLHDM